MFKLYNFTVDSKENQVCFVFFKPYFWGGSKFFFFLLMFIYFEREKDREHEQGKGRETGRQIIPSRLCTVSVQVRGSKLLPMNQSVLEATNQASGDGLHSGRENRLRDMEGAPWGPLTQSGLQEED